MGRKVRSEKAVIIPLADVKWLREVAMTALNIDRLRLRTSSSRRVWPDIWINLEQEPPVITVTREWARQNRSGRRQRLTHELLHAIGFEHGVVKHHLYSSTPKFDSFSRLVYRRMRTGGLN